MKALFTRKTRTTAERSEISERSSEKSKGRLSLGRSLKKLRLSIEDGASKKSPREEALGDDADALVATAH